MRISVFARRRAPLTRQDDAESSATSSADVSLVARLAAQDPEALREAYGHHAGLVHATAVRLLGDHQLAEECTQDVFMTLWRSADTIDLERGRLTTWLYVVTRNRAIALSRGRAARPAVPMDAVPEIASDDDHAGTLIRGDAARQVVEALAELPDDQRQVIVLAYFEELSQRDIADRLNLPLGTVKGRARLALDRLRVHLADAIPGDDR